MKKEVKENKKEKKTAKASVAPVVEKETEVVADDKTLDNDGRVGTMLKDTRLKKGEELENIAKTLRIRTTFLEAIENRSYDELPPAPYGQGFVRAYADYLGLNPVRIAQLYREETDANNQKKDLYVLEPQSEATVPNRKYIMFSLLAIVLVYVCWVYYSRPATDLTVASAPVVDGTTPSGDFPLQVEEFEVAEPAVAEKTSKQEAEEIKKEVEEEKKAEEEKLKEELPVIEVTSAAEKNTPQVVVSNESFVEEKSEAKKEEPKTENMKSQAEKATSAEIKSDAKVVIKVNKEAWIEAKSPTKLYLSKVVQGGFTYNVPEEEGMIISIGRYDAADVYVNGKLTPVFTANKKTGISVDDLLKAANH